ncbi:MAG TPA: hypothetical protein VK790_08015 [Solirubrobacteraceae bacterium]|jgi:hypothetical protein|nr:hypothetical protein [Solirubrobacteraceae bacterium]
MRRIVPPAVIPVLALVAIAGYLLGNHRAAAPATATSTGAASVQETQIASGPSVLLEYPAGWRPASGAPAIPGLSISSPLLLAPGGDSAHAGLLSGQLPAGASSPLPAAFLALVHGLPHTEVLSLTNLQAYRYSGLSGYERTLDVYVVPTVGSGPTALICYAATGYSSYLQQCEQIVAKVALVGQQSPTELSPNAAYAGQLSAVLKSLEAERVKLRREMQAQPEDVGTLAATLASRFAHAATAVSALEPPQPATAAQVALTGALTTAHEAYATLAAVGGASAGDETERRIDAAEAGVDSALESFALLGYNHT